MLGRLLTKRELHHERVVGPGNDRHYEQHREPLHRPDAAGAPFRPGTTPGRATAVAAVPVVVVIVPRHGHTVAAAAAGSVVGPVLAAVVPCSAVAVVLQHFQHC